MLALRIALRYLSAARSHKAVSVISVISVAGVAVATMAIVVVLSVFNGFADLSHRHLALIDPDLKITPARGKVFAGADSLAAAVETLPEVAAAVPSLQERALAVSSRHQMPVVVRGVAPERYTQVVPFDSAIIDGFYNPAMPDSSTTAAFSVGAAMQLEVRPAFGEQVQLYVPRRRGRINPANPAAAYRSAPVALTAVFAVDQPEYDDDYVVTDIALMRALLDYHRNEASSLEVKLVPGINADEAARAVNALVGDGYLVLTRERQQYETFRMIAVEKWVTFLMLAFILVVACFNIVTTLSLMVIEKRGDMRTLRAMGATRGVVNGVFAWEGALITTAGGAIGIGLGTLLAWLQQRFGLIKLNADPSALSISVYPVRIESADILTVALTVMAVSAIIALIAGVFTRKLK